MRFTTLTFSVVILLAFWRAEAHELNKKCYTARICIHDGNEKCGMSSERIFRRFYDTCDLLEYNCLYNTDYKKTHKYKCNHLPDIDFKNHRLLKRTYPNPKKTEGN